MPASLARVSVFVLVIVLLDSSIIRVVLVVVVVDQVTMTMMVAVVVDLVLTPTESQDRNKQQLSLDDHLVTMTLALKHVMTTRTQEKKHTTFALLHLVLLIECD